MNNELTKYEGGYIRSLTILMHQGKLLGEAYINYRKTFKQAMEAHDLYHENPGLKSRFYAYQSALINLESAKAMIYEFKDGFVNSGVCDWLP